jgi:hypothetical protein
MKLKALLWRLVYAVILVVILTYIVPLLFTLVGIPLPSGTAITLLKYAFACLLVLYIFFGPTQPADPF